MSATASTCRITRAINWRRVRAAGIEFAYIKASEGTDVSDPRFRPNWDGARAAGLETGAYHFFSLCSPGLDQAGNFLQAAPAARDAMPPAVDLEIAG
ncbi:MAG TPA: GH25 family lysozyme, partial [Actinomycetota bacterium]